MSPVIMGSWKMLNGLTKFKRIMDDAANGKIDDSYLAKIDPTLRDFAAACRRLCNTLYDQFSTDASVTVPVYDEESESYL